MKSRSNGSQMMQKTWGFLLACLVLAGCVIVPPAAPPKPQPAAPAVAVPALIGTPVSQVVTPQLQALMDGLTDGQALLRFTIQADGSVHSPRLEFFNLSPSDSAVVLAAIRQWRFKPAIDGHHAVERDFIYPLFFGPDAAQDRTRFFCHHQHDVYAPDSTCKIVSVGQWRIYRMNPVYPLALLSNHLAGSVTLTFNVGPKGQVIDPRVVKAAPPGLFDASALAAVKQWYFEPLDGKSANDPPQHVTVTVKFTPPAMSGTRR